VPIFDIFSENSKAPHKLIESHKAKDLILLSLENLKLNLSTNK